MRWLLALSVAVGTLGWGSGAVLAEKRVALVVGNSAYRAPRRSPIR